MNGDEFGFFNHQLASMLREGIPLEGALKELSLGMRDRRLRSEIEALQADLGTGTPLKEALSRRDFPEFYRQMVEIGARSNDLPGLLTLLADHYERTNTLWTRLKGLLVYPFIVVIVYLALTILVAVLLGKMTTNLGDAALLGRGLNPSPALQMGVWFPPIVMAVIAGFVVAAIMIPNLRSRLRWILPAFREASVAQVASALGLMLRNGLTLSEALSLAEELESRTPAQPILAKWRTFVEAGQGRPAEWHSPTRPFPPLFMWMVQRAGEDPAKGFEKAAEMYRARAGHRMELVLYGALPISILLLGQMILWQVVPLTSMLVRMMNVLSDMGDVM